MLYTYSVTFGNVLYARYNANIELRNITITEIIAHLVEVEPFLTTSETKTLLLLNYIIFKTTKNICVHTKNSTYKATQIISSIKH